MCEIVCKVLSFAHVWSNMYNILTAETLSFSMSYEQGNFSTLTRFSIAFSLSSRNQVRKNAVYFGRMMMLHVFNAENA